MLYALEDHTNFLARSNNLVDVKTARIPIPGQSSIMTLGVVAMRHVMAPVMQSSPELFSDPMVDYSVYVKDITEEDEPFVGQGLVSSILSNNSNTSNTFQEEILVPGRVCSNFASLLNKGSVETLEIRLRLAKVTRHEPQQQQPQQRQQQSHPQSQTQQPLQPPSQGSRQQQRTTNYSRHSSISQPKITGKRTIEEVNETNDDFQFAEPKPIQQKNQVQARYVNTAPAPKAARTQSLPTFDAVLNPPPLMSRFPPQSIARRIYLADKNNVRQQQQYALSTSTFNPYEQGTNNNYQQDAVTDVSKRFAPDFIAKIPDGKKGQGSKRTSAKRKQQQASNAQSNTRSSTVTSSSPMTVEETVHKPPICFHCKNVDSKNWRWNEADDESQRGLLCNQCYQYLKSNGVMRPQRLITKQNQMKQKKKDKQQTSSSPNSSGNDTITSTTPLDPASKPKEHPSQYYSSDPITSVDDMVSDLDFHFGPMTDIDPLPVPDNVGDEGDKENVPPRRAVQRSCEAFPVGKASRQSSFEKMLAKSFSGVPPPMSHSPSEWITDLFNQEGTGPTPKDFDNNLTPADFDHTPRDMTTCNTLPCNEESPEADIKQSASQPQRRQSLSQKGKVTVMPSSPLLLVEEDDLPDNGSSSTHLTASNANLMTSDWPETDDTRLGDVVDALPPKAQFTHNPQLGNEFRQS